MEAKLIHRKLEHIEKDIRTIRSLMKEEVSSRVASIKGLWKGIKVSDEELKRAKKSVFKHP